MRAVGRDTAVGVGYRNNIGGGVEYPRQYRIDTVGREQGAVVRRPKHRNGRQRLGLEPYAVALANQGVGATVIHRHFRQREDGHANLIAVNHAVENALGGGRYLTRNAVAVLELRGGPRGTRGAVSGNPVDEPTIRKHILTRVVGGDVGGELNRRISADGLFARYDFNAVRIVILNRQADVGRIGRNPVVNRETVSQRIGQRSRGRINRRVLRIGLHDFAQARADFLPRIGVFARTAAGQTFEHSRVADADFAEAVGRSGRDVGQGFERTAQHQDRGLGRIAAAVDVGYRQRIGSGRRETRRTDRIVVVAVYGGLCVVDIIGALVRGDAAGRVRSPIVGVRRGSAGYHRRNDRILVVDDDAVGAIGRVECNLRQVVAIQRQTRRIFARPEAAFARFHHAGNAVVVGEIGSNQRAAGFGLLYAVDVPTERRRKTGLAYKGAQRVGRAEANRVARAVGQTVDNRFDALDDIQTAVTRHNRQIDIQTFDTAQVAVTVHIERGRQYVSAHRAGRIGAYREFGGMDAHIRRGVGRRAFFKRDGVAVAARYGIVFLNIPLVGQAAADGIDRERGRIVFADFNRCRIADDTRLLINFYRYGVVTDTTERALAVHTVGIGVVRLDVDGVVRDIALRRDVRTRPLEGVFRFRFRIYDFGTEQGRFALIDELVFVSLDLYGIVNVYRDGILGRYRTGAQQARRGMDINLVAVFEAVDALVAGQGHRVFVVHPAIGYTRVFGSQRIGRCKQRATVVNTDMERVVNQFEAIARGQIHMVGVDRVNGGGNHLRVDVRRIGTDARTRRYTAVNRAPVGESAVTQRVGIVARQFDAVEEPFERGIRTPVLALGHIGNRVEAAERVARNGVAVFIDQISRYVTVFDADANCIVSDAVVRRLNLYAIRKVARIGRGEAYLRAVGRLFGQARGRRPRIGQCGVVGGRIAVNNRLIAAYQRIFGLVIRRGQRINGNGNRIRGEATRGQGLGNDVGMRAVGRDAYGGAAISMRMAFVKRMPFVDMRGVGLLAAVECGQRNAVARTDVIVGTGLGRGQRQHIHPHALERGAAVFIAAHNLIPCGFERRYPRHGVGYGTEYRHYRHDAIDDGIFQRERTRIEVVPNRIVYNLFRIVFHTGRKVGHGHLVGVKVPIGRIVFVTPIVGVAGIFARRVNRVPIVGFRTIGRQTDAVAIAYRCIGHYAQEVVGLVETGNDNRVAQSLGFPQATVAGLHDELYRVAVLEQMVRRAEDGVVATLVVVILAVDIPVVNRRVTRKIRFGGEIDIRGAVGHAYIIPRRIRIIAIVERHIALIRIGGGLLLGDVVNAVVVQVVNHAVGNLDAQAVTGLISTEATLIDTLFINFKVTTASVGGEFDIMVVGPFRMLARGGQTYHEVGIRIAYRTADGTVVVNQLLRRGTGIPVTVTVQRGVAAAERQVVVVAPGNRFFDNRVALDRVGILLDGNIRRFVGQNVNRRIHFHHVAGHRTFVLNRHTERKGIRRGTVIVNRFQCAEVAVLAGIFEIGNRRETLTDFNPVFVPVVFGILACVFGTAIQREFRVFADRIARGRLNPDLRIRDVVVTEFEDV